MLDIFPRPTPVSGPLKSEPTGCGSPYPPRNLNLRREEVLQPPIEAGADYADMNVDRATADAKFGFTVHLAEVHAEPERQKVKAKDRLEATWGSGWEDLVGHRMPRHGQQKSFSWCAGVLAMLDVGTAHVLRPNHSLPNSLRFSPKFSQL